MKVGIVGSGFGVRTHLPAFTAHPNFEVVALASPHSAKAAAGERNIPHAFTSVEEMLAGCELDVVSIASPPFMHRHDVLAALKARKHVICEKPFALNVAQAEEMVAAAKEAGTACAVMHEFRWVPQHIALKELIVNDHLTPLRQIEISQLADFLAPAVQRKNTWWFEREKGGGISGALLSHLIDLAIWLAGRAPVRSTGYIRTAVPERHDEAASFKTDVDDGGFAVIDFGDGLVGRLVVDGTLAIQSYTCGAHAGNRTAVASGPEITETRLFAVDPDETSELDVKESPYQRFTSVTPHVPLIMELLDEFVKQVETGTSGVPTFEDALRTQRVLESIGYSWPPETHTT